MSTESGPRDEARELRNRLVEELVRQGAITSQQVQQAFEEVPRRLFVPRVNIATAYSDEPIFIRWEDGVPISSSSQPKMMALMMEQLGVEPGSRVLEIGAGTGYNAAILAHVVGEKGSAVTIDIDQDIVDEAAENLSETGYGHVEVICGDGYEGFPEGQPYDGISVTVGAYDVSPHWVDQLKEGGVIVVPLWFRGFCLSVALEKRDGELRGLSVTPCLFIPLRGTGQPTEEFFSVGDPPTNICK
jgi:protein-L-isoaspartate(D-aspartate) O-methyltransferase